jgi:hypothetical protein
MPRESLNHGSPMHGFSGKMVSKEDHAMAGRPRKMLARVAAMEDAAYRLACDACEARPEQYAAREGAEGDDDVALWWNRAARDIQRGLVSLDSLLCALEWKAGLGDGPEQGRLAERGFVLEDATTPAETPLA